MFDNQKPFTLDQAKQSQGQVPFFQNTKITSGEQSGVGLGLQQNKSQGSLQGKMFDSNYGNAQNTVKQDQDCNNNQCCGIELEQTQTRGRYLRNLYFLLAFQLLISTWFTSLADAKAPNNNFAQWVNSWSFLTYWISLALVVALQFIGLISRQTLTRSPIAWLFYIIHTLALSFLLAYFEYQNGVENQLINYVLNLTFWVVFALFVHSLTCKNEITFQSATLYILGSIFTVSMLHLVLSSESILFTYVVGFIEALWAFYLVWESETIIGVASQTPSVSDTFSAAFLVYSHVILLFLNAADLIRQHIIKDRA